MPIPLLKVTSPGVTLSAGVAPIQLQSLMALAGLASPDREAPAGVIRGIANGALMSILIWMVAVLLIAWP